MPDKPTILQEITAGTVAGFAATLPMSLFMSAMQHTALPAGEDSLSLPPRVITENFAHEVGEAVMPHGENNRHELKPANASEVEAAWKAATLAGHFGYGAATGALYGALSPHRLNLPPVVSGMGWGLAVWGISYLGWLPATGLYPSATQDSPRRIALMVGAHLVWGATLGVLTHRFLTRK